MEDGIFIFIICREIDCDSIRCLAKPSDKGSSQVLEEHWLVFWQSPAHSGPSAIITIWNNLLVSIIPVSVFLELCLYSSLIGAYHEFKCLTSLRNSVPSDRVFVTTEQRKLCHILPDTPKPSTVWFYRSSSIHINFFNWGDLTCKWQTAHSKVVIFWNE